MNKVNDMKDIEVKLKELPKYKLNENRYTEIHHNIVKQSINHKEKSLRSSIIRRISVGTASFLTLGILVFLGYSMTDGDISPNTNEIVENIGSNANGGEKNDILESDEKEKEVENENSKQNSVGLSPEEQARIERLENGILLYGEGYKGGYYGITVNSAYSERRIAPNASASKDNFVIVVSVTVKNVRDQEEIIDLSELQYNLNEVEGNKTYIGKVVSQKNSTKLDVQPNESLTLDVSFEIPTIEEEYKFNVISSIEPIEAHWKIDNIKSSTK